MANDAVAYARALADGHRRNGNLAADMVTEAVNVTAEEALDAHAIKAQTLDTTGLSIERRDMPFFYELLQLIVDPTISYLLLLIGMIGIAIELLSGGGVIVPGARGGSLATARHIWHLATAGASHRRADADRSAAPRRRGNRSAKAAHPELSPISSASPLAS